MKWFRPLAFASGGLVAAVAIALTGAVGSSAGGPGASPTVSVAAARDWAATAVAADAALAVDLPAQREAVIQRCMAAAGWEYIPMNWAKINAGLEQLRAQVAQSENELLAQSGYGLTASATRSLPQVSVPDGDPNLALVAKLSAEQKLARTKAFGPCAAAAQAAVPDPNVRVSTVDDITPRVDEARRLAQGDPRLVAATASWSHCMSTRGFSFSNRAAAVAEVQSRVNAIRSAFGSNDLSPLERNPGQAPKLAEQLGSARSHEMAVAAADLACKGDLDSVAQAVEKEYVDAALLGAEPGALIVTDPSQRPEAIR